MAAKKSRRTGGSSPATTAGEIYRRVNGGRRALNCAVETARTHEGTRFQFRKTPLSPLPLRLNCRGKARPERIRVTLLPTGGSERGGCMGTLLRHSRKRVQHQFAKTLRTTIRFFVMVPVRRKHRCKRTEVGLRHDVAAIGIDNAHRGLVSTR